MDPIFGLYTMWGVFSTDIQQKSGRQNVCFMFSLKTKKNTGISEVYTPPKFNSSPGKNGGWKTTFLLVR